MNIPKLQHPQKYTGLYVVDFGDSTSTGFTANEVAQLLESEKYKDCKVYKIHNANPDGTLELKGVTKETFQLEAGMFFYENDLPAATSDYDNLIAIPDFPCTAKAHLAEFSDNKFVTAIIYPAEYDDQVSHALLDNNYKTKGLAEGGTSVVQRYYDLAPKILKRTQLFANETIESRTGDDLLANLNEPLQRKLA